MKTSMRRAVKWQSVKLVSLVLLGLASFAGAQAQSFPEKPIRIVSTFPAGGAEGFVPGMMPPLTV